LNNKKLYFFAFLEGAFVVSIELLGGKMLSPVFGSSLYIWTSVIGVTLLSLTIGYFLGGMLSSKENNFKKIYLLFSLAGILALLMPVTAQVFFNQFLDLPLFAGCMTMSIMLLTFPLICLGATSPILIQMYFTDINSAGRIAGRFYAISTVGGIVNTFFLGFFIIPSFGLRIPLFISCFIILLSTLLMQGVKLKIRGLFFLIFTLITIRVVFLYRGEKGSDSFKDIYESEGIMGQLKVVDFLSEKGVTSRALLNNNSAQSIITKTNVTSISQYNYVHFISAVSSLKPENSNVLLFGMAGGSLIYEMQKQGFNIDVVDIDERTFYIAERYFYFQKNKTNLFTDDARHFIRTTKKKYDIVIIDISSSEVQPSYLYTKESFEEIKNALMPEGLFFINFQGILEGKSKLAVATWSVFKTLEVAGLQPYYYSFNKNKTDDVQFVSSAHLIDFSQLDSVRINSCCTQNRFVVDIMRTRSLKNAISLCEVNPFVLLDDKPQLEELKFETVKQSRNEIRKEIKKREELLKK
jgi:spermidine synthase